MADKVLPTRNSGDSGKISTEQGNNSGSINDPKEFDVQEANTSSGETTKVEKGGTIDLGQRLDPLNQIERFEKLRIRKHLTYSMLSLSIVWILVGIIYFLKTGNSFLLFASSPMSGPILIIMGYYFGDNLLQKHLNRGP